MYWGLLKKATRKGDELKKDKNADKKEKGKREADREGGWEGWKNQDKSGEGGGCQQGLLRQCDMAHAINSGSAEGPCLAICSGSGAFERVGVTSTTAPTTMCLCTDTENPPSLQFLAWQTPDQARVHFHKTIAQQPAPVSGGRGHEWNRTVTSLP